MGYAGSSMKLLACLMGLIMASISHAEEIVEVMTSEGSVLVGDSLTTATRTVQAKTILPNKNALITGTSARAVVRVGSDGYIVIGEKSQVEIDKVANRPVNFRQVSGKIYYALNAIKGKQSVVGVRTASAVLGIRGTRFLVTDISGRNEIGMRKGLISVTSPEGEFEIHKKVEQDEFKAFKQEAEAAIAKQHREFEDFKANSQKEFIEYKREFGLEANRMATFDGKRVVNLPLSVETKKDMKSFETYAQEWLKNVND